MDNPIETIRIRNPGMAWDIAANIHFPPDFDKSKKYPTVISAHPIGSCKEQTSGNVYGAALAREGFVVIAFDASYQGASGGEPRLTEDPGQRVEDFRQVSDYLVTLPYVDADRIGVLGVCGGGGYSISAAKSERRIRAVVTITGANFGRLSREGFGGYDPVGTLEAIAQQRTTEARGGKARVDDVLPASVEAAKEAGVTDIDVLEATDYYKTPRGQTAHGLTSFLFSRRAAAMDWDAFHLAEVLLTQPLLVVVGDKPGGFGAYRDGLEIYGRAASKDKELLVLPNTSHYELYDQPEATTKALEKVVPFFKKHLAA
ncbi:alpha/beta hydrolase [Microbulbifer halophilus]|uniref:Alpha/beta hydrolase n=1 Tax=Microbulbifer halophilus TaxID=453963 RepID=A0ABW5E7Y0_9GAMM|nr:alpha/beta hydrolase [Microbulbifer halophilus]MCW8125233.1 alpha/beta hydrolase [Microbulbifer halophilus]